MAKLVPNWYAALVPVLVLAVYAGITVSDDSSSSSYYSWNYGGVSSNDVDSSLGGDQMSASEETQYDTPPSSGGDGYESNTSYESRYANPPYAGADDLPTISDVTYASPPNIPAAPSSESDPNNSNENYFDQSLSSSSYDKLSSSASQSDSPSSSSYDDSFTSSSDDSSSSLSSSSDDLSTPSPSDDSFSPLSSTDDSSSSSSTWEEDSLPITTDESQSGTGETYNSVEAVGSGVDSTDTKTEHSGSNAGLVFGLLIGVCAVGAAGFIYIKKKRESYLNTNSYISLTRWDRI